MAPDDELLGQALEAFADLGYGGTSVRELCRRLGVSHNLVHQRFGSKEALWYAAVDHGFGTLALRLAEAVADGGPDAPDDDLARLRAVWVRFVEVTATSPALLRVITTEATTPGPRLTYIVERYVGPAMAVVDEMVDGLVGQGRLLPAPAGGLYFLVGHGIGGPLFLSPLADLMGDLPDPADADAVRAYAELTVDLVLRGLTPNGRTAPPVG